MTEAWLTNISSLPAKICKTQNTTSAMEVQALKKELDEKQMQNYGDC